jgi:hypothetical protein
VKPKNKVELRDMCTGKKRGKGGEEERRKLEKNNGKTNIEIDRSVT